MTSHDEGLTNLTEREQQLRQLAHDIQTPLSVITMGLEAIKSSQPNSPELSEIMELIQQSGVGPLKAVIAELVETACKQQES